MSEESKSRIYWAEIHPERATDEWQKQHALPRGFEKMPKKQQEAVRQCCQVTPEQAEQLRACYAAFPALAVEELTYEKGEWAIVAWKIADDNKAREAIWLAEQLGGAYEGDRERFMADWEKGEYEPDGLLSISGDLLEIKGELKHKEDLIAQ